MSEQKKTRYADEFDIHVTRGEAGYWNVECDLPAVHAGLAGIGCSAGRFDLNEALGVLAGQIIEVIEGAEAYHARHEARP